jgi:hypothetical protein
MTIGLIGLFIWLGGCTFSRPDQPQQGQGLRRLGGLMMIASVLYMCSLAA